MQQQLLLIRPSAHYEKQIAAYKEEFLMNGDSMDGTAGLMNASSIPEWLHQLALNESEETVQRGFVPSATFLAVHAKTGRLLGMIDIRHRLNNHLLFTGGHIKKRTPQGVRKGNAEAGAADMQERTEACALPPHLQRRKRRKQPHDRSERRSTGKHRLRRYALGKAVLDRSVTKAPAVAGAFLFHTWYFL